MTINAFIQKLSSFGDRVALVSLDKEYTYEQLINKVDEFKGFLESENIAEGSIVMIDGDYCLESIAMFVALYTRNCIVVPSCASSAEEKAMRHTEVGVQYVYDVELDRLSRLTPEPTNFQMVQNLRENALSGLVLFSSGSTGKPKAMIHDLTNLVSSYVGKKSKKLTFLIFLLFDHIGGINTLLNVLSMGGKMVVPESKSPEYICGLIERHKVNILPASPSFLNILVFDRNFKNFDMSSLRLITYGTEVMPDSLLVKLKSIFPKVKFLQTFGTSETGIMQTVSQSSESTFMKIEDPNVEYKIVENELWLKSKTQVMGYLNYDSDSFTEDGWFKTGDLVETMEGGYLRIIGRSKEVINVGGEKVLPQEVESVLLMCPNVKDCLVRSEPHPLLGNIVHADIALETCLNSAEEKRRIKKFCRARLEPYKVPVKIKWVDTLSVSSRYKKVRA